MKCFEKNKLEVKIKLQNIHQKIWYSLTHSSVISKCFDNGYLIQRLSNQSGINKNKNGIRQKKNFHYLNFVKTIVKRLS